jgi:hypothetical protein
MAILILVLLVPVIAASPVFALDANSMWIEPPAINYTTSTPIGTMFNVTVWMNVTSPVNSWQFYLTYDGAQLNATRCGYTGDDKSLWSGSNATNSVEATFGSHNSTSTYEYVLHGEVLKSSKENRGAGALSWVEFNVTAIPAEGQGLTSEMRLDLVGPFRSYAMDHTYTKITPSLSFGKTTYVIPEFPITALLFIALMITAGVALVFRKRISQTLSF